MVRFRRCYRSREAVGGLGRTGLDAQVIFSPSAEIRQHAEQALEQARDGRIDAIVVGGGDGTVGIVAGVLTDTGVPLGILPFGTLNHFAKDLGLPLEMKGAVQVIATAATRNVDVAEVKRPGVDQQFLGRHLPVHGQGPRAA